MRTRFIAAATAAALTAAAVPAPALAESASGSSQPPASWQAKRDAAGETLRAANNELAWAKNEQRKIDLANAEVQKAQARFDAAQDVEQAALDQLNEVVGTDGEADAQRALEEAAAAAAEATAKLNAAKTERDRVTAQAAQVHEDPAARIAAAGEAVAQAQLAVDALDAQLDEVLAQQSARNAAISGAILAVAALLAVGVALLPQYKDKLPFDVPDLPEFPGLPKLPKPGSMPAVAARP